MNKYAEIIKNDKILLQIKPFICNIPCYIVGGFVRDVLMGKTSTDRDIIVCCDDVKTFSQNLANNLDAHFIELDKINKIYRIVLKDKINYIDITVPVENDLEKDIKRRDLTINAVAFDCNKSEFIDIIGGIDDIRNKKIRGISDKNFEDDPLRLLRIFRFHSCTGFDIDENLIKLSKKLYKTINCPAKERVNAELLKMFEGKYTDSALLKLDETGMLEELFPIFKEVKKIPPNSHHHLDLFHHLIETVNQIQLKYEEGDDVIKIHLDNTSFGAVKRVAFLKLAAFLHDIGKPSCWTIEEDTGRHRFIKHDEAGAKLAVPVLKELKFSKKQTEYIKTLIKYHIYPSGLISSESAGEKAFLKFYRKMDDNVIDVILLAMADRLSARGEKVTDEMVEKNILGLTNLLNEYILKRNEIKPPEKLLDGVDIMELLHINQGPDIGKILNALYEAQLNGLIRCKEDAVIFVLTFPI